MAPSPRYGAVRLEDQRNFAASSAISSAPTAVKLHERDRRLGTTEVQYAGDGAIAESTHLAALGQKIEGSSASTGTSRCWTRRLNTPPTRSFFDQAVVELRKIDPSGPLPDRYVQSNFEAMNFLKLGMQKSKFRGAKTR